MGSATAPPATILPETVAAGFTKVYYGVLSKQPAQLQQLYGADSEISHVPGVTHTGLASIAAGATSVPLASKPPVTVTSLDAMSTGPSSYVVVVTGLLEGVGFAQTFVLAPLEGNKAGHFYCRNDIFRFVAPTVVPVPVVAKAPLTDSPAAVADAVKANGHVAADISAGYQETEVETDDGESEEEEADDQVDHDGSSSAGPPDSTAADAGSDSVKEAPRSDIVEDEKLLVPPSSPVKPVVDAKPVAPPPPPVVVAPTEASPSKPETPAQLPRAQPPRVTKLDGPPKPKTWASIVSNPVAAATAQPVAPAAEQQQTPTGKPLPDLKVSSPVSAPKSTMAGPSPTTTAPAQFTASRSGGNSNGHGLSTASGNNGGNGWNSVDPKRQSSVTQGSDGSFQKVPVNGLHTQHHVGGGGFKHNPVRAYGPSAVIHLATLPSDRLKNARVLQAELVAEFGSYGHALRHVEVKLHKQMAFAEFESLAGVQSAVSAWADGPRSSGSFKGLQLVVSEKRHRRPGEGGSMGGRGRGGTRGGGRGGGRGRGRGMQMASSSSGPSQSPPPAATSS